MSKTVYELINESLKGKIFKNQKNNVPPYTKVRGLLQALVFRMIKN